MYRFTISIIILVFMFNLILSILNYKNRNTKVPENVKDVYNEKDYSKWLEYTHEIFRFSTVRKIFNTVFILLFIILDLFPLIADISNTFTSNIIFQTIIFFAIYASINYIFNLFFHIYKTFSIEDRYGFNNTSLKTFILDQFKSIVMSALIGFFVLYTLLYLYQKFEDRTLIYAWLFITALSLVINVLYTNVFIRIFNKLTPLSSGELFDKAQSLVESTGYKLNKISIIDASRRSARLNAFFSGFGRFKHIVIYDTLVDKCSTDEIISVLAHEIGHAKNRDVLVNFVVSILQTGTFLALLAFFLSSSTFATAFGFLDVHIGFSIILFAILMEPIGIILNIPLSFLSRKAEYRADTFAKENGYKDAMISALKILARENYSNLTPHPLLVKMTYSHPPISMRINSLNKGS